jgi:hypothetical protein
VPLSLSGAQTPLFPETPAGPWIPSLTWAGEKLRPEWTAAFLAGEVADRPRPFLGPLRMPSFSSRAALLARGMAREHGLPPASEEPPAADRELAEAGRRLAGPAGGLDCQSCHDVGGARATKVFESQGPNFALARERLRKEWFVRWVLDPLRVEPDTRMPQFFPEGRAQLTEVLGGDAERQIEALWQYLADGRNIRPPGP